ncbi:MAG: ferritin-like domain-containing protein [Acidobacteriota bacterium]
MDVRELLIEEMQDQYDAEKQLVKALPKMAKAASSPELSQAFESHLEETRGHVQRLEKAFEMLGVKAKGKSCAAMKGLIEEAQEVMAKDMPEELLDSAMICAAQKVEHYEMAGYGTLCAWAKAIGMENVAKLLQQTLEEEREADEKLTEVAETVLAAGEADTEEGAAIPARKGASAQAAASARRQHAR